MGRRGGFTMLPQEDSCCAYLLAERSVSLKGYCCACIHPSYAHYCSVGARNGS